MIRRIVGTFAVLAFVATLVVAQAEPVKPAPAGEKPLPAAEQERILAQFRHVAESLLLIAQRLEKSTRIEDVEKARTIRRALAEADNRNIESKLRDLSEKLAAGGASGLKGYIDDIKEGRSVAVDIDAIIKIIFHSDLDARNRERMKFIEGLIKDLELAIRQQEIAKTIIDGKGNSDIRAAEVQDKANQIVKDILGKYDKFIKDQQGDKGSNVKDSGSNPKDSTATAKGDPSKDGNQTGTGKSTDNKDASGKDTGRNDGSEGRDGKAKDEGKGDGNAPGKDSGNSKSGSGNDGKDGQGKSSDAKAGSGNDGKDGQGKGASGQGSDKEGAGKGSNAQSGSGNDGKDGQGKGSNAQGGSGNDGKDGQGKGSNAQSGSGSDGKDGQGKNAGSQGGGQGDGQGQGKGSGQGSGQGQGKSGDQGGASSGNKGGDAKGAGKGDGSGQGKSDGAAKGAGKGAGKGEGSGQGAGKGDGKGASAGQGAGKGQGSGQGQGGAGKGQGQGSGQGQGQGKGEGAGQGSGQGKGEGSGSGKGEGSGKGGEGSGSGSGKGGKGGQGGQGGEGGGSGGKGKGGGDDDDDEKTPGRKKVKEADDFQGKAIDKAKKGDRKPASEDADEAKERLEKAKKKLEEVLRQMREEEIERILADLRRRCEKMLAMQELVYDETRRIDARAKEAGSMTEELRIKAAKQSTEESKIIDECTAAITIVETEGTAVAFPELFHQLRNDMTHVKNRLALANVGKETQAIEEDIIAALKEMIEALKKQQADNEQKPKDGPPPKPGPQDPNAKQKLIDLIAELKLIKAMQERVNARTKLWAERYPGEQAEVPEIVQELKDLAARQSRIQNVTNDIAKGKNR